MIGMTLPSIAEAIVFTVFALVAVGGAIGMTTTMSMFRSGLFLMASFVGVAGLFILLSADLLAWLQVMMYIGGMLVMILFMVLFSHDPGGRMMAAMDMPPLETFFSGGLRDPATGEMTDMDMADMSMTTPVKRPAAAIAAVTTLLLCGLILWRQPWPVGRAAPDPDSPARVGELLLGKYMMAFETAGLLILLGVFGAVFLGRPGRRLDPSERDRLQAAVDGLPASIDASAPPLPPALEHPPHHQHHQ